MAKLVWDLESNGLLEEATKIHCLVTKDRDTGEIKRYSSDLGNIEEGIRTLESADELIGHNLISFDLKLTKKLYPWFTYDPLKVTDTLMLSRMLFPTVGDKDAGLIASGKMPKKLYGSHSLEAWGYRLGVMKGDYKDVYKASAGDSYVDGDEWKVLSQEMLDYNEQDVVVTDKFYELCLKQDPSDIAVEQETRAYFILDKVTSTGWPFNEKKAVELYAGLAQRRDIILKELQVIFPPIVTQRVSEKTGKRLKDSIEEFNPGSRQQISRRLKEKYQWEPRDFTPSGEPKIDEDVLGQLDYPEAKVLAEYFTLVKRLGQISEGDNGWLKLVKNGRIHGRYNPNGAISQRCTHSTPNLGQVPAVRSPYGPECRELFTVPSGWMAVGADLSGIELRLLGHYLWRFDQGKYAEAVVKGSSKDGTDVHTLNTKAFGFTKRDSGKTGIYAFLYGCGGLQMFTIAEADAKLDGRTLTKKYKDKKAQERFGRKTIKDFLDRTPAIKKLREAVSKAAERGYVVGLDGRKLIIRSAHSALNQLLQGGGAAVAKQWLVEIVDEATRRGWVWNEDITSGDYALLGFIHDETFCAARPEIAEEFGKMLVECAYRAGQTLGMKVPVSAEYDIGKTWKDVH